MRIKRLQLAGFKSCMEKTTLEFPRGITGIVGPNGCGKSNIVDALRWVLGEQSAKHLRGQVMEDVIFVGNDRYSPLGLAEVSITLDNEGPLPTIADDAGLDGESAGEVSPLVAILQDAAEIEVTRRLYRSGESEYLINGRPCRLRDITELFLGTGVGTKAYSIIEQGRVGQIVNAKPEELRLFIEEAAGTTLYRSRKLAAERKIERTRNNLLRVSDILAELERQAASLRRQVRGAIRYKELKAEEERLDRYATGLRLKTLADRLGGLSERLAEQRDDEAAIREESRVAAGSRDQARARADEAAAHAEEARKAFYESRGRLTAVTQERQFLEQRCGELASSSTSLAGELAALTERVSGVDRDIDLARQELEAIEAEMVVAGEARSRCDTELAAREQSLSQLALEVDGVRERAVEALASEARIENELAAVRKQRELTSERLAKLREEESSLGTVTRQLLAQMENSRARLDGVVLEIDAAVGGKEAATRRVSEILGRRAEAERMVAQRREDVSALGSRYESLRELNDSFAGYADGVRSIMRNLGEAPLPLAEGAAVVADVIDIEPGYERAAAAVLGDQLQFVIVGDPDEGVAGAEYLRQSGAGRASFLPRFPRRVSENGADGLPEGASWLRDHVQVRAGYELAVEALLHGVVVSGDLRTAVKAWESSEAALAFVTPEGDLLDTTGVVTGGSGKPGDETLLARKAELRGIRIKLVDAEVKAREAKAAFEELMKVADEAGASLAEVDRRLHELTVSRVAAEGELEIQRQNLLRTEDRQRALALEAGALVREEAELREKLTELQGRSASLADDRRAIDGLEQSLAERRKMLEAERDALRSDLAAERVRDAELVQKSHACVNRLRALEDSLTDLYARKRASEDRRDRDAAELEVAQARLADPGLTIDVLEARVRSAQEALDHAEQAVSGTRSELAEIEKALDTLSARLDAAREDRAKLELAVRECELERASLEDGLRERLGEATPADIEAWADLGDASSGDEPDLPGAIEELERIRAAIRRLGVVNVGAVTELEEIDSRLGELGSQKGDLERSMEDLRGTIARLNRLSRQRFKDTFDRVNEIFQHTFPRLFQGGKAWLSLTDENNLLETGVEIFVQPPGKKLGNINLMSGGEKALTAVSLIFSLFLHKPSPFCVLDEVDAPLDDANIGRFARMVLEMSDRSQFLLITHNKKTMESCDTLYGVTMREPGVSKIVSVEMSH